MSLPRPGGTLPIRRWLLIALACLFAAPVLTMIVIGVILFRDTDGPWETTDQAVSILRDGADRWDDPAWQAEAAARLGADGIDVVLVEGDREVLRTGADPLAGTGDDQGRDVRRVVVTEADPRRTADIYATLQIGPPEELQRWFVPVAFLSVLLLTLTGIAWFFGRTVVRPLTAASTAARRVAEGDLDIDLPPSRVREVAELTRSFEAMRDGLRASLERQAEVEQERRLLIGAIVHDLRTPLFSLRGSLEGLATGVADTPERRDRYVAVARDKADALEHLVTDLFAFTRLEYLDQAPNRAEMDIAVFLARLVEGSRALAEAADMTLTASGSPSPFVVDADEHLLARAIGNLLDNALRHTPRGGEITVGWSAAGSTVRITVADTGPGIPEVDLPHLFAPLYRGERSRNRKTGGAGLGLTIARRVMLAHGGDLVARNRPEGGAAFIATLPQAATIDA